MEGMTEMSGPCDPKATALFKASGDREVFGFAPPGSTLALAGR